jgi:hypothetical protein
MFFDTNGVTLAPPSISEMLAGSGIYKFSYSATNMIAFLCDGGGALSSTDRYISNVLDPIQSVDQKTQPFYWKLIEAFRQKTGIPMLINTSFNDSEPIVLTAEDALKCFMTTEMDYLLLENRLFSKKSQSLSLTA